MNNGEKSQGRGFRRRQPILAVLRHLGATVYPLQVTEAFRATQGRVVPGSAFDRITSIEGLKAAWGTVLAKDAADGELRRQTIDVIGRLDEFIADLSKDLREGSYMPEPVHRFTIPKKIVGESRELQVPTVRDKIVEHAVIESIGPAADRVQSSCSFAYRQGIGVPDAVQRIAALREEGYRFVLRADIHDCFSNISIDDSLATLYRAMTCERTIDLIYLIASPRRRRVRCRSRGIAQGSCLSPLLANLALTDVDIAMSDAGFAYVRYADDAVVCTPREDELLDALDLFTELVRSRGLTVNEEKTMLTSFDEEFCYLGVDFSRSRPNCDPHHHVKPDVNPDHVLYIGRDGACVRVSKERLIVEGVDLLPHVSIPRRAVNRIVLTGSVGLSAGARSWALYNDVDVLCLSRRGTYLGQLAGPRSTANAQRLLRQAEFAADVEARMPLARSLIRAKMRNQVHVLHRIGRRDRNVNVGKTCQKIRSSMEDLFDAASIDEIFGIEGAASSAYFACLAGLVPEGVSFPFRSRRPPKDMANAAFSYGYAILLGECTAALFAAGLEPSLGVLHASTDKRPSLSLDLMEEFRPLLVDRTVVSLLRSHRLRPEHASPSDDGKGVWLNREGKKALVDGYEATLQRRVKGALPGFSGTWRRHIHHSAQLLGRAIMERDYEWMGVSWR